MDINYKWLAHELERVYRVRCMTAAFEYEPFCKLVFYDAWLSEDQIKDLQDRQAGLTFPEMARKRGISTAGITARYYRGLRKIFRRARSLLANAETTNERLQRFITNVDLSDRINPAAVIGFLYEVSVCANSIAESE